MGMLALIRNIFVEPAETFKNIEEEAAPAQAGGIVVVSAVLFGLQLILSRSVALGDHVPGLAVAMIILHNVVAHVAIWLMLAAVAHTVGVTLSGGMGTFRKAVIGVGCAYVPWLILSALDVLFAVFRLRAGSVFPMLCAGWFGFLFVSLIKHGYGQSAGKGLLGLLAAGLLAIVPFVAASQTRLLMVPLLLDHPRLEFLPKADSWMPADVPEDARNLVRNGGFEEVKAGPQGQLLPVEWDVRRPQSLWPMRIEVRETRVYEGRRAAVMEQPGPALARVGGLMQLVRDAAPGPAYLSARVRTEGVRGLFFWAMPGTENREESEPPQRADTEAGPPGASGDTDAAMTTRQAAQPAGPESAVERRRRFQPAGGSGYRSDWLTGTAEWRTVRMRIPVPEDADSVWLAVYLWGRGTAWLDDVTLYQAAVPEEKDDEVGDATDTDAETTRSAEDVAGGS